MDSAEFLDLLGNANRRRILRLLARKPCYVTEISEFIGVSPKAVIDHLQKLEDAGLVESRTDDRRRKYFSISRNIRLEVTVSPYEFGTKSAYPASSTLDLTACRRLSIEVREDSDGSEDAAELTRRLQDLEQLDSELSLAQRWVQGRLTDLRERLAEEVDAGDPRLVSEMLLELADGGGQTEEISHTLDVPPPLVEDVLDGLAEQGVVYRDGHRWHLDDE